MTAPRQDPVREVGELEELLAAASVDLFVLDARAPLTDAALTAAADDLVDAVGRLGPDVRVARRLLGGQP